MKRLAQITILVLLVALTAGAGLSPVDPRVYGAKCDGTTDDAAAFSAAITKNPTTDVFVPESSSGCLIKSNLQLSSGQTLFGYGPNSLLVQGAFNNVVTLNTNATVRNLKINGQYTSAVLKSLNAVSALTNGSQWTVPTGITSVAFYVNSSGTATVIIETSPTGAVWTQQGVNQTTTGEQYAIALPGGTTKVRLRVSAYTSGTISGWIVGWGLGSLINSGVAVDGASVDTVWLTNAPNDAINFADGSNQSARNVFIDTFGLEGILATVSAGNNTGRTRINGFDIRNGLKAGIDSNQPYTSISNGVLRSVGLAGMDAATAIWIANNGYDLIGTKITNVESFDSGSDSGNGAAVLIRALGAKNISDTQISALTMNGGRGYGLLVDGGAGTIARFNATGLYAYNIVGKAAFYFGQIAGLSVSGIHSESNTSIAHGGTGCAAAIHVYLGNDVIVSGFVARSTTGADSGGHNAAGICAEATDKFIFATGDVRDNAGYGVLQTGVGQVGGYTNIHTFNNTGGRFSIQSVNVTAGTNWGT